MPLRLPARLGREESQWPTIPQAAAILGVHQRTLRRYIREQRIAKTELAVNVVRIRPQDIEKFTSENVLIQNGTGSSWVPRYSERRRDIEAADDGSQPGTITRV